MLLWIKRILIAAFLVLVGLLVNAQGQTYLGGYSFRKGETTIAVLKPFITIPMPKGWKLESGPIAAEVFDQLGRELPAGGFALSAYHTFRLFGVGLPLAVSFSLLSKQGEKTRGSFLIGLKI